MQNYQEWKLWLFGYGETDGAKSEFEADFPATYSLKLITVE